MTKPMLCALKEKAANFVKPIFAHLRGGMTSLFASRSVTGFPLYKCGPIELREHPWRSSVGKLRQKS